VVDLVEGQDFVHSLRNMAGDVVFTSKAVPSLFRYHYRKPNFDSLKDVEEMDIIFDPETDIKLPHASSRNLSLYPNPASNYFSFDSQKQVDHVKVIDISGKEIMQITSPSVNKIDISALQQGVYTVQVSSGTEIYRNLLIVK